MGNVVRVKPTELMAVVRLRHGVVGECRRVSHLVPVPAGGPVPEQLVAVCGELIVPGQAEVLDGISGMPCEGCLARHARYGYHALSA